ncbi:hypothetical protein E2C01_100278 [Portunus trituberculatus]|uniref:Uncharacterized protein n=1 Tax=Portunus trituberculatus TaxID=210409 RepID=A0A5B7K2L9_PORTR|nr:hypothetical protein [Portunus trituberculatus]
MSSVKSWNLHQLVWEHRRGGGSCFSLMTEGIFDGRALAGFVFKRRLDTALVAPFVRVLSGTADEKT